MCEKSSCGTAQAGNRTCFCSGKHPTYVCMYVCMYVCIHACIHVGMYVCSYRFCTTHICIYVSVFFYILTQYYMYMCVRVHVWICLHVLACLCNLVYTHTRARTNPCFCCCEWAHLPACRAYVCYFLLLMRRLPCDDEKVCTTWDLKLNIRGIVLKTLGGDTHKAVVSFVLLSWLHKSRILWGFLRAAINLP